MQEFSKNHSKITIENTTFDNIILTGNTPLNFILITNLKGSLNLKNVSFFEIKYFKNVMLIKNVDGSVTFENTNFSENYVDNYLLNIENVRNISIIDTISWFKNNINGFFYESGGGSFLIYNSIVRLFINVQVLYAFSVKYAFGFIIIDDNKRENNQNIQPTVIFLFLFKGFNDCF